MTKRLAVMVVAFALIAPSAALAASTTLTCHHGCATASQASSTDAAFPFTLLDAALLGAGASVLLAAGIAMRRLSAGAPYEAYEPEVEPLAPPQPISIALPQQPTTVPLSVVGQAHVH
jgi:hypothetical protein